ncbi:MAG TPA: response regulator [Verrucomicrobiae bacterium]|nr:response regulator [Verrucomicrobiae bacterium]
MSNYTEVEVLLVEDNARDAEMTLRTLRKRNLANSIVHVKDGQEALDWLFGEGTHAGRDAGKPPKVVLLDLKLPKVDGLEVLRAMRSDERTRLIPVVVMTSSREERDVIESYKLGVNSYVVKPMDFEGFSAAVAELGHYWLLVNQEPK